MSFKIINGKPFSTVVNTSTEVKKQNNATNSNTSFKDALNNAVNKAKPIQEQQKR